MKKTYIIPTLEMLSAETEQMLAVSTFDIFDTQIENAGDVLAPTIDLDDFFVTDQNLDSYFN